MKSNINQTLKKKLILSPKPKCNKREFWQLYDRMIGDKNDVVEFLDVTETQKKFELSRKILVRIAFESNFPPAMKLMDYIHGFESTVRYKRSVSHAGRDHYIHLCYLYLLGIYMFFYFPQLNGQLRNTLSLVRISSGINEESSFVKNFISVWKYFVLYHDIAYQFEYLGNKSNTYSALEKEEWIKVKDLFDPGKIKSEVLTEVKKRALATLVAIYLSIDDNSGKAEKVLAYLERNKEQFEKKSFDTEIIDFLSEKKHEKITFLKYIKAGDDVKYYLTLYKYDDFFVVLKKNSNITYILGKNFFFADKDMADQAFVRKIVDDRTLVFSDEWHVQYPDYEIEYYGINLKEGMDKFLRENGILETLLSEFQFMSETSMRMKDVVFDVYLKCCDCLKEEGNQKKESDELEKICKEKLFEKLDGGFEKKSIELQPGKESEYASDFLKRYCKYLKHSLKSVKEQMVEIAAAAVSAFKKEQNVKGNFQYIYDRIGAMVDGAVSLADIDCRGITDISRLYHPDEYDRIWELQGESDQKNITSSLQYAVKDQDGSSVRDILECYHTCYSEYDHGIAASNVFNLHYYYYQKILTASEDSILIRMCFNIPNLSEKSDLNKIINNKYTLDYAETIWQVSYAILVHNLYPQNFTEETYKGMKISIEKNPLAYFCMLCDALQDWGRPFNINPIEEEYPLFIDSLKINIKFDDYINVKFEEDNPRIISERLKPFAGELETYLEGAGNMMKVKFF